MLECTTSTVFRHYSKGVILYCWSFKNLETNVWEDIFFYIAEIKFVCLHWLLMLHTALSLVVWVLGFSLWWSVMQHELWWHADFRQACSWLQLEAWSPGPVVMVHRPVVSRHVGSFQRKDGTHVPCIGMWIFILLYHQGNPGKVFSLQIATFLPTTKIAFFSSHMSSPDEAQLRSSDLQFPWPRC